MGLQLTHQIGVIGLGLIGGSLAKALLINNISVHGYDTDTNTKELANADGVQVSESVEALVNACDLVFVATPQSQVIEVADHIARNCEKELIISDVGSVKMPFHELAFQHTAKSNVHWIGAHPLAGTEYSGYPNSISGLFSGAVWAVSLDSSTRIQDYLTVSELFLRLGGKVLPVSPEVHDDSVARISHFPYIISALVIRVCPAFPLLLV